MGRLHPQNWHTWKLYETLWDSPCWNKLLNAWARCPVPKALMLSQQGRACSFGTLAILHWWSWRKCQGMWLIPSQFVQQTWISRQPLRSEVFLTTQQCLTFSAVQSQIVEIASNRYTTCTSLRNWNRLRDASENLSPYSNLRTTSRWTKPQTFKRKRGM